MRSIIGILFIFVPIFAAQAQHFHPAADADLHTQFYSNWLMPNGGNARYQSCCNKKDCYPTSFKEDAGTWFAKRREDGAWMPIPRSKLEHLQNDPRESPDGQGHVCAGPPPYSAVYCAVLGSGI